MELTMDRIICYSLMLGSIFHTTGFYIDTNQGVEGTTDDLVISGLGSGCQYEDEDDCAHHASGVTDSLISPIVKITTTPQPPSTRAPPAERTPSPSADIEASGEGCEGDDEDCETTSGNDGIDNEGAHKSTTDDIIFNNPDQGSKGWEEKDATPSPDTLGSSTLENIVVTVNMTETPPKKNGILAGATTKKPLDPDQSPEPPVPSRGGGGGGAASGGGGASGGAAGGGQGAGGAASAGGGEPNTGAPSTGDSKSPTSSLGLNIGLIVGIAGGVVLLLLILAYAIYKYKSRDEGTYKVDEGKNYRYDSCNTKPPPPNVINGTMQKSGSTPTKPKKKDVKEWYV